jgi:hypothetical protein
MASTQTFMALYSALVAAYPTTIATALTPQVFFASLADIPDEDLASAVAEWLAHGKRFPFIADLRELALADRYPLAAAAWREIKAAFQTHGRHEKPTFSHPLIATTVADLGWDGMCASKVEDEPIIRAQFTRAYQERVSRETFDRTSLAQALQSLHSNNQPLSLADPETEVEVA